MTRHLVSEIRVLVFAAIPLVAVITFLSPAFAAQPLFLPASIYDAAGGGGAWAVSVADLNGDGKADMLVTTGNSVDVLLGNGDGTFKPAVIYPMINGALGLTVADMNGDGKPDIIVASYGGGSNGDGSVEVLLGNGDGTFQSALIYDSGGPFTYSVAVADFNKDGKLDVVVTDCSPSTGSACGLVGILLGNGDGTFKPVVVYNSGGVGAWMVTVSDLNGDSLPDLVVANLCDDANCSGNGVVSVLLGNGDGTFKLPVSYDSAGRTLDVVVADINGDGKADIAVLNACDGTGCSRPSVGVLRGNGDGTFAAVKTYGVGEKFVGSLALADIDGDGALDAVVSDCATGTDICESNGLVSVLLGNGDGTFRAPVVYGAGGLDQSQSPSAIALADLNNDGRPDIVVANCAAVGGLCETSVGVVGVLINIANASPSETTLTSSPNPSNLGQTVTFTAAVRSTSGTPTGSVNFYDGSNLLGSAALAGGSASLASASLGAGSHSITATYQGSITFAPSTSAALNQVVNGTNGTTTTTLTSSKNPSVYQTPVTFTAVVTASSGTPTGTVTFYDGSAALGNGTLSGGTASLTTSSLVRGPHSITASYLGAGNFAPSVSTVLNQVVNLGGLFNTQTKLNHPGPSFVGQPVTFIATVTSKGGAIPDGDTVTFSDESLGNLGTGITHSGVASFTTSTLSPRSHIIGALYNGDANFNTSFTKITQVVNKYPTTTVLKSSLNPATYGLSVTFTATVTSSGPTPTGTVRFTGIGSATLVGGVATFTKPQLRAGNYAVTADYVGDADSATSKSAVLQEVVNPASTTTTLTSSANPSSSGQSVTFTATVTSSTGIDPFGKVTFTAGATTLGSVALKDNVASISTSTLPTGSTKITATYGGAAGFTGSAVSLTQVVKQ